jgi:hypothetical protein
MVENKLLPGTRVFIVGGHYKHLCGVLRYEIDMRYLVLVDGMDRACYLLKTNVIDASLAGTHNKESKSVVHLGESLPDTNVESLSLLLDQLKVAKQLITTAQQMLDKCEGEVIRLKNNK